MLKLRMATSREFVAVAAVLQMSAIVCRQTTAESWKTGKKIEASSSSFFQKLHTHISPNAATVVISQA